MAFSYQKSFALPTENVGHDLLFSLLRDHNVAHMVDRIRALKSTADSRDWTQEREFQEWFGRLKEKQRGALAGKSSQELALAWADGLKHDLPLVIFVGNFDDTYSNPKQKPGEPKKEPKLGRWRKKEGLRLNGLCVMDLDHVVASHNPDDVRAWWQQVSAHLDLIEIGIKMVYVSASGDGVKVVFWKKKIYQNGVKMKLDRPMGFSALSDEDFQYHNLLMTCRRRYKYQDGTHAFVSAKPFDDVFDLICRSKKKDEAYWTDIEQGLKMFYASLTTTEVDSVAASEIITNLQNVATQSSIASVQSRNRINCLPFESSKRLMPPTVEEAGRLSVERLRELVKDYYSNFNGSLFLICGDVNQDSIMPLVLKYIGSLPSKPEPVKRLVWSADHYKTTNTTAVEKFSNPSPLCVTALYYTWEKGFQLNQDVRALNHALQSVLGELLMNRIRVQHSDVYTPVCQVVDDLLPVPRMRCAISYTCNPTQRERIAKDVMQLVNEVAEGDLITQELVDNYIKNRESARKPIVDGVDGPCSDYIERELNGIVLKNDDLTSDKKVTPSSLKAHLKQLLKKGNLHVGYMTTE